MKNLLKRCVGCKDDNHREVLYGCVKCKSQGQEMYFILISSMDSSQLLLALPLPWQGTLKDVIAPLSQPDTVQDKKREREGVWVV